MYCRLHIKIIEAQKVLKMNLGCKSDPYVTLQLKSQTKREAQRTQTINNTTDPIWNKEFDIIVSDPNDILLINMYDDDIKNDDKMMDELQYPVNMWPIGYPLDHKELDIKLKKKRAGKFIFEVQSFSIEEKNSNTTNNVNDKSKEEKEEEEENCESQHTIEVTESSIKLLTSSIKHVPLINYEKDFTFIINDEQFKTTKIISDLISPKISKMHQNDPTISEFYINTKARGDFQKILNFVTFESNEINKEEIEFVSEIFDQLEIENVSVKANELDLKIDNVIDLISNHQKSPFFYSSNLDREIEYLSKHFYEINESHIKQLLKLSMSTIEKVICNDHLRLESEDQLLKFINQLYVEDIEFAELYEYVFFSNVESESLDEFLSIFNYSDLTAGTWHSIFKHFRNKQNETITKRYRKRISFSKNNLNGVFNYFQKKSNIEEEVKVTSSSYGGGDWHQLIQIDNSNNNFYTNNENNPWICFEFKKHQIIPTSYTIKSCNASYSYGNRYPKNWVIEGSEDNKNWEIIDEQQNCEFLKGSNYTHTFSIKKKNNFNEKEFKFIRIRHIGNCWNNSYNALNISSIELYGTII